MKQGDKMLKQIIYGFIAISTSIPFLFCLPPTPTKHFYHSSFVSHTQNSNDSIAKHLFILTRRPHVAGTEANAEAAAYVLSTLSSFNIQSRITTYDVALTYPVSRSLTLKSPNLSSPVQFDLRQEIYNGDPYADVANEVMPTFHAYAKSGTAIGPVVYANYGRLDDFTKLKEMNVNVSGTVVLARYGEDYRGDIVANAYAHGASGVLIFTDRKDYGGGGGDDVKWFPEDRWMPPSGVQVGSVYNGEGDPTTPGWASTDDCERLSEDEVEKGGDVPLIPSLPISWSDGYTILRAIGGHVGPDDWQGGKDAPVYRLGPGPASVELNYLGKQVISTIQNVIGVIEGAEEPDRFVILGNHRDAWTFGAVDPNSGTASLLEVAERLMKLHSKGWRPRRTIIFCNWDAEEYGLVGSTEWVEENRELLASRVVAYLNVDCAVTGAGFHASATPQLDDLLREAAMLVVDPDNSSQSIYQSWNSFGGQPTVGRLGAGSDYAPFLQHVGIPATDMSFGNGYPVYHSMYDDFFWMSKFGDPTFQRHTAAASLWGLIALKLADREFLPFNYLSYATELQTKAEELRTELKDNSITLVPLFKSIKEFKKAATKISKDIQILKDKKSWVSAWKTEQWKVREVNDRLMMTERAFIEGEGLPGRPWFKHLIYAPSKHDEYGSKSFPGVYDSIEEAKVQNREEAWRVVQHEVWRVSRAIKHASLVLNGQLT